MSDFAERFEDLRIWQQAHVIVNEVYEAFAGCRDYSFHDQIQRASVSSGEVRSLLYLAQDGQYMSAETAASLRGKACGLLAGIAAFRRTL